jgi:hypothetical protein
MPVNQLKRTSIITLISMTTDKLKVNASQEESAASTNKRVWVKPVVELISVLSGHNPILTEGTAPATQRTVFVS